MEEIVGTKPVPGRQVLRLLTLAQSVNAVGDGMFYVTSALFFARVVGLSPTEIGAGLSFAWAVGFLLTTPLGQLADRVGLRRAAVGLSLVTAVALALSPLSRSLALFVAVTTLYAVSQSASNAVRQALLVTLVDPEARVLARARVQTAVNAGIGLGASIGGLALLADRQAAYVAVLLLDAAAFAASAVLLTRLPDARVGSATPALQRSGRRLAVLLDRPYVAAALVNAVLYLYMPMLSLLLPLYVAERTAAPTWTVGALFVLNTAGVALLQVRAARTVSDLRSAVVAMRRAGLALLLACVTFAFAAQSSVPATAVLVLAAGAALQIAGEVLLASGSWEIGFALADPDRPGQWQALFSSGVPLARAVGPLALTSLVLSWSGPGWLVLGLVFAGSALLMGVVVAWAGRARAQQGDRARHRLAPHLA